MLKSGWIKMCIELNTETIKLWGIPSLLGVFAGWGLSMLTKKLEGRSKSKKYLGTLLLEIERNQRRLKEECKLESYDSFQKQHGNPPGAHLNPDYKMDIYNSLLPQINTLPEDSISLIIDYYETLNNASEKIKLYNTYLNAKEGFKKEFYDRYCESLKKAFDIGKRIITETK